MLLCLVLLLQQRVSCGLHGNINFAAIHCVDGKITWDVHLFTASTFSRIVPVSTSSSNARPRLQFQLFR